MTSLPSLGRLKDDEHFTTQGTIYDQIFQIPSVEAVITPITDVFPSLRKKWKRILFVLCYCILGFCIGLTMVTRVS